METFGAGNNHTAGILVLNQHAEQARAWMKHTSMPFFIRPINAQWSALLIKDEKLEQPSTVDMLIEFSKFIFMIAFFHDEDWGWGYRVFINGFEVAHFYDDYHFDHRMAIQLAQERYPEIEDILYYLYFEAEGRSLLDSLVEEVNSSRKYLEKQFENKNVQCFETFGFSQDTIAKLDKLISIEGLRDKRLHWRQVEQFKEYLGITEMKRINYKVLSEST
jgi:hypothetical protein